MRKRTALEWRFAEDPDEWERLTGLPTSVTRHSLPRRIVWAGLLALLVLLSGTGVWLWQTAQAGLATIETEVDAAANADLWIERQATADVQLMHLDGGVAVVEVALPASAGLPGLRQTRVYRQTGDGWRRTPPSAALWGEVRRLETNHFVFDYRQLDEDAVKASAAHLERLYPAFYAAFLSGPLPAQPRAIQVDPGHAPGDFTLWQRVQTPIVVASPAAYLTPGDVTPEELLTQAIVLRLLDDFEYQLALQYEGPYLREYEQYSMAIPLWPVVSGVALWQLWASDLPLAQWRVSVVQRIFADRQLDPGQPYVEPAFTLGLCAMHGLWMKSPIEFHLPFACDARFEQSVVIQRWLESRPRGSSTSLPLTNRYITVSDPLVSTRAAALATMVEYAAATYGPERIPRLLETMDKYDRWEPLVVEVFGVSAETFEAGWADYLAAHYGLTIFTRGSGTPMH